MTHIPIEAKVECADGLCGETVAVIVHPVQLKVTHVVVEDKSKPRPVQRLVPVEEVEETTSQSIRLRCTQAELAEMEPFVETHYVQTKEPIMYGGGPGYPEFVSPMATIDETFYVEVEEERVPAGELAIHRGTPVEASDGPVGKVGELVVDSSGDAITHFVLQEGHLWGKKEITLPLSAIDLVQGGTVYLKLDKKSVGLLPAIPLKRRHGRDAAQLDLFVRVYDTPEKAQEALEFVQDLHDRRTLKIRNAAILVRDEDGKVKVKDTRDIDPKKGRILGAVTGGLIGLVGGPIGAVAGALVGAGAGGVAGRLIDFGFSEQFLDNLQQYLQPGTAALVLLAEHQWVVKLSETRLAQEKGVVLQQALTDKLVEEMTASAETE